MKAFKHQLATLKFLAKTPIAFDASDPGTGKTYVQIMDFAKRRARKGGRALIVAPKSLLTSAWKNDFQKFAPQLRVTPAYAHNRASALADDKADAIVINHDAVDVIAKQPAKWLKTFDTLIVDESTAFKHHTSQRSRTLKKLSTKFKYRRMMSGTPAPNTILDLWHQVVILDGGQRLGPTFAGFRNAACIPEQVGPQANMVRWRDRPGIENIVATLLKDIMIRHKFEDCVDIPANHRYAVEYTLSPKHQKLYEEMQARSLLVIEDKSIDAVNGAVLYGKLLQISSGAVYGTDGSYTLMDTGRYNLVLDLVEARAHSIVFYTWQHQLDQLAALATSRKLKFAVWNPDKPEIEKEYQAGHYQVLFAHPQSAGHGLTLTKGTATIWASPTHTLEHFLQGLKRVHRIGQTQKTETIVIVAKDTIDERVFYDILNKKDAKQQDFLTLAQEMFT